MRIPEKATLITETWIPDENGIDHPTETTRDVYGYVDSVTASEIFEGGRNGLNPELRFTMTELDYNGETILVHGDERYSVYRSYRPNNGKIELYAERKGGTNG